jgi:hypothetical protein
MVYVKGYYRKDGTYVESYLRSYPTYNSYIDYTNSSYTKFQ